MNAFNDAEVIKQVLWSDGGQVHYDKEINKVGHAITFHDVLFHSATTTRIAWGSLLLSLTSGHARLQQEMVSVACMLQL